MIGVMVEACEKYRMELSALLDEQLDKQLKSEVEEHLSGCTDCSQEMETLKSLCQLIGREMEPDNVEMPDLWAKMKDQVPTVCQVMDEDLSAYLDGELEATQCEAIEAHCQTCPSCAAVVHGLRETIGLCRGAVAAELPDAVKQKAQRSISQLLKTGRI